MATREGLRPGGRSARVQESVHAAVNVLLEEMPRHDVTVPQIAARAGVTPSTIYRRWGDLHTLLADVAVQRFYPDAEPADMGSLQEDLEMWAQGYQEEMASAPGRALTRDVLAGMDETGYGPAVRCCTISRAHVQVILDRAMARGEWVPSADAVMNDIAAPVMYRLLFDAVPLENDFARTRVVTLLTTSHRA